MPRSTKQKEKCREIPVRTISSLPYIFSGNHEKNIWDLNPASFESSECMPLDFVKFNPQTNRYTLNDEERKGEVTEDDFIAQAMVVFVLYRMEMGWGDLRTFQELSVWCGKPPEESDEDAHFPLENLWEKEIKDLIANKKLGKKTLGHPDNFCTWRHMYDHCYEGKGRWARRSNTFLGNGHILAEQAAVQIALHLHENVCIDYSILAATLIHYALRDDGREILSELADSIIKSARKESDNFAKVAFDHVQLRIQALQEQESKLYKSPHKKQKLTRK